MILYKTVYSTKSGAPRMWKKLLVTRWLQCFNVPSCSIMFNFVSRESPIPPTDFNERFVFLHGKVFTSIGSNSVVRVRWWEVHSADDKSSPLRWFTSNRYNMLFMSQLRWYLFLMLFQEKTGKLLHLTIWVNYIHPHPEVWGDFLWRSPYLLAVYRSLS